MRRIHFTACFCLAVWALARPTFFWVICLDQPTFGNVLTERYRHDVTVTGNAGGISDVDDMMSQVKNLGLPRDYNSIYSAYGSPPDVWGRGAIGLDYSGQPMAFYMGEAGETVGDPYEQVLNRQAAGYTDAPFSVAELERVLRYYDRDALGLPNRLLNAGLQPWR